MKRELDVILLACLSLLCFSCKKFSDGETKLFERQIDTTFQVIEMCDNVNVTLEHCDAVHPAGLITIKTGENLIDGIITKTETILVDAKLDDTTFKVPLNKLVIQNNNALSTFRPYDYDLDMTVYYDSLYILYFNSNGTVKTADTLRGYYWPNSIQNDSTVFDTLRPSLRLEILGGSGDYYITMNCHHLTTKYIHGTSCLTMKGYVKHAETRSNHDCHGIIDGKDLEAKSQIVNYYGTNKVYVKVVDRLTAKNYNIGSIYYVKFKKHEVVWVNNGLPHGEWIDSTFRCPQHKILQGERIYDTVIDRHQ